MGRDCYPSAYVGLDQTQHQNECHSDNCNNRKWEPWVPTKSCLNCEATWTNGIIEGDLGCFDGTAEGEPSDEWVQLGCPREHRLLSKS